MKPTLFKWVIAATFVAITIVLPTTAAVGSVRSTVDQRVAKGSGEARRTAEATQKAFKLEATACKSLGRDMRMAANADVTKSDAIAYAKATQVTFRNDKRNTELQRFLRDANAFVHDFTKHSPFHSVSLAVVKDCAAQNVGAPLIPAPITPTAKAPSINTASSIAAVTSVVERSLSLPANEITVSIDNDQSVWAYWTVNDPNVGIASGFAELVGGSWEIVAGPGSSGVGCPGGGQGQAVVPPQVMTYFGAACPASSSGNSGNTGGSNSDNSGTGGELPTVWQYTYPCGYGTGSCVALLYWTLNGTSITGTLMVSAGECTDRPLYNAGITGTVTSSSITITNETQNATSSGQISDNNLTLSSLRGLVGYYPGSSESGSFVPTTLSEGEFTLGQDCS